MKRVGISSEKDVSLVHKLGVITSPVVAERPEHWYPCRISLGSLTALTALAFRAGQTLIYLTRLTTMAPLTQAHSRRLRQSSFQLLYQLSY